MAYAVPGPPVAEKKREKERKRVKEQTERKNLFFCVFFRQRCSFSSVSSLYSLSDTLLKEQTL